MGFSFFVLRRVVNDLSKGLEGARIENVISPKKNGVLFEIKTIENEELGLSFDLEPRREMIRLRSRYSLPRKNFTTLFPDCIGKRIKWIQFPSYDRLFQAGIEEERLLEFRVFGHPGSIVLFQNGKPKDGFKVKELGDQIPAIVETNPDFSLHEGDITDPKKLRSSYPFFDKLSVQFLESGDFFSMDREAQIKELKGSDEKAKEGKEIFISDSEPPELSVFPLQGFSKISGIQEALREYEQRLWKYYDLEIPKQKEVSKLEKEKGSLEKRISQVKDQLKNLGDSDPYSAKADLLMANLHLFGNGKNEAEVENFYTGNKEILKVKPGTSPQKQAEKWYSKSKNRHIEFNQLQEKLNGLENKLGQQNKILEELRNSSDSRALKGLLKESKQTNKKGGESDQKPYRSFDFNGFEIRVGKSGEKNDLLLSKHSRKDDLWFHVRDAAGSHVIIPWTGKNPPEKDLIQRAASLAVYYSKRKNEMNCPVIMTQRKFVRKIKGAKPGLVKVEREKVVFADPIAL